MVQKLKKRYFIANMVLLSCTLMTALTALFVLMYRAEVQSSYDMMSDLLSQNNLQSQEQAVVAPMVLTTEIAQDDADRDGTLYTTTVSCTSTTETTVTTSMYIDDEDRPFTYDPEQERYYHFPPYWNYDEEWWNQQQPPPPPPEFTETLPLQTTPQSSLTTTTSEKKDPPPPSETKPLHTTDTTSKHTTFVSTSSNLQTTFSRSTAASSLSTVAATSTKPLLTVPQEGVYVPDAFIAEVNPNGQISAYLGNQGNTAENEDFHTVNSAVSEIHNQGKENGTLKIDDVSYRYVLQATPSGGYQMVLLSRTLELSMLSRMLILFVVLIVFGLACMAAISLLLANWTVRPIALAWEKQKQFVADASHELKTPLAVISANTEVILANPYDTVTEQSKWLNYIKSETIRMSKLVTNLLTVARMDHNKQAERTVLLNFYELVSNVCLVFEPIIYENGKTLNTVLQRSVMLHGDEDNLKQLLSILLDNAVLHSTPCADITVTLSKDAQGKIRLAVANSAKDIPDEELAHLFDRFYRLDHEGSPNGSGLGLSIARSIVRDMDGVLTAHSENGVVTFVATFPST